MAILNFPPFAASLRLQAIASETEPDYGPPMATHDHARRQGSRGIIDHRSYWIAPRQAEPIPGRLLPCLEQTLGEYFSNVHIYANARGDTLTNLLGASAVTCGNAVHLRRDGPFLAHGTWLLAHEFAHVTQQRRSRCRVHVEPTEALYRDLEMEADQAAWAVLRGHSFRIPNRRTVPEFQANPLIPIAVAVGLLVMSYSSDSISPHESDIDSVPPPEHLYETPWGFMPVVGSLDEMINGRNWWNNLAGTVFFIMDLSTIPAMFRGVVFKLTPWAHRRLIEIAGIRETSVQRAALARFLTAERGVLLSEDHTAQIVLEASSNRSLVLIGAQSGREGIHHSVVYIIVDGKAYKLHGGIYRFAAGVTGRPAGKVVTNEWLRSFNTLSVYGGEALEGAGLYDSILRSHVDTWAARARGLRGFHFPRGCAFSQALLLEEMGIHRAPQSARYLPLLLERSRMAQAAGVHYVVNAERALRGTQFQMALERLAVAHGYVGVRTAAHLAITSIPPSLPGNAVVYFPVDDLQLSADAYPFPENGHFTVGIPDQCLPDRMCCPPI